MAAEGHDAAKILGAKLAERTSHRKNRAPQIEEFAEVLTEQFGGMAQVCRMLKEMFDNDDSPSKRTQSQVARLLKDVLVGAAKLRSQEQTSYELLSTDDLVLKLREILGGQDPKAAAAQGFA